MNLCSTYGYFCIRISSETLTGYPNKHEPVITITNCISLKDDSNINRQLCLFWDMFLICINPVYVFDVICNYYGLMSVSA